MNELPTGWIEAPLSELGSEIRGSTLPVAGLVYELYSVPTFATRRPETVDGSQIGSTKRPVRPGDVLLCKINPRINRVWVVADPLEPGREQIASTEYLVLRATDPDLSRYLMWYLRSPVFRDWIKLSVEGATGSHTRSKSGPILKQRVPLSPLNEQRRIVAAIEEHLSRLDAADASLVQAKRRMEAFVRATVVSALDGDWRLVALSDVTESQVYGTSSKASFDPDGVPVLRMGNINAGRLDLRNLKYLPSDHPDVAKFTLELGDVLFNRTNSPELVGKSAVFTGSEPMTFASYLIRVRLASDCDPRWAVLVINGPPGRRYIASVRSQQVGQANVNGTKLAAMPIPLPPLEEQQRIVAEVEERLLVIDAMQASIERAQRRSAALRRSILERAFSGELVPQDPSDEPASVLLDHIRAERPDKDTHKGHKSTK